MNRGKITIQNLIWLQLILSMVIKLLTSFSETFNNLTYITDITNIILFCLAIKRYKVCRKDLKTPVVLLSLLIIYDLIELVLRQQGIALFLWGARNQYRFFMFFISFAVLCKMKDLYKLNDLVRKILIANLIAVAIEFVMGYRQDLLSGLFGIVIGSNNGANLFLCIAFTTILVDYLCKRIKLRPFILCIIGILLWAAAAELKYFFIEAIVVLFIILMLMKKGSRRKIAIIGLTIVGGIFGLWLLTYLNPYYKGFFNVQSILYYANNISIGAGGYKRVNAIPITDMYIFNNNIWSKIFGLGLGSAEQSTFSIFNSLIYERFSYYNYTALFYGFTYIERGWFGLIWYSVFFLASLITSVKELKHTSEQYKNFLYKAIAISVICFLQMVYDDALRRIPAGFMVYAFLAIPFIIKKENRLRLKSNGILNVIEKGIKGL